LERLNKTFVLIITIGAAIYFLSPFYWIVISLTKNTSQLYTRINFGLFPGIPSHLGENFRNIFTYDHSIFKRWFLNSFFYSSVGALGSTLISASAGFAFSRYNFLGKRFLYNLIIGFVMVPGTAFVLPLFILFHKLGLLNSYLGVILPCLVSIFGTYLMIISWDQIPIDIFDSAEIDGANDVLIFFRIGLPLIIPSLLVIFILNFVQIWNNFFLPLVILNDPNKFPLTLGLSHWNSLAELPGYKGIIPIIITGTFFSCLPLIILFLSLQKYFLSGSITGAIKY